MNLDYDDGRITCPNCGKRDFPEVGMSACDCQFSKIPEPKMEYNNGIRWQQLRKEDPMGWYSPEPECTADVGVMGHLGCNNPNCSCKPSSTTYIEPIRDYQGNVELSGYYAPDKKLKHKGIIHETPKAKLFAIKVKDTIYEIWAPKSCIRGLTEKKVTVSASFYGSSVCRQIREQGGVI